MSIRPMNISDYNEVFELWNCTKGMGLRSLDDSREGIEKFLARNPGTCLVAEEEHRIIGIILGGHDGRRGYLYHTAVLENCRNRGIGKELVKQVLNAFTKEGINRVALVVFKENETGNSFWETLGFEKRSDLVYRNISLNEFNT